MHTYFRMYVFLTGIFCEQGHRLYLSFPPPPPGYGIAVQCLVRVLGGTLSWEAQAGPNEVNRHRMQPYQEWDPCCALALLCGQICHNWLAPSFREVEMNLHISPSSASLAGFKPPTGCVCKHRFRKR